MRNFCFFFLLFFTGEKLFSQSIRAGEIRYTHVSGFTYQFYIDIYSNDSLPFIILSWGGATIDTLQTDSSSQSGLIYHTEASAVHTFPGIGTYVQSIAINSLMDDIANIQYPTPQPFYIEDTLKILDPAFYGYNNSPVVSNPQVDFATVNQIFIHNPNAFDADGDSMSFSLVPYFANGYSFPSATDSFSVNAVTGELVWDKPTAAGNYALGMLIREWRSGVVIGTEYIGMMITVNDTLTGINEIASEKMFSVYPNPASSQAILQISMQQSFDVVVELFDGMGRKVKTVYSGNLSKGSHLLHMNVNSFHPGNYLLRMKTKEVSIEKKLVIVK